MAKRITASHPLEAYWVSRTGHVYEVLGVSKDYNRELGSVHVLNMRTGDEKVLRERDFKKMKRLHRRESWEIYQKEYGDYSLNGCDEISLPGHFLQGICGASEGGPEMTPPERAMLDSKEFQAAAQNLIFQASTQAFKQKRPVYLKDDPFY